MTLKLIPRCIKQQYLFNVIHFNPSLTFVRKSEAYRNGSPIEARSQPFKLEPHLVFSRSGFTLARKYKTKVEVYDIVFDISM